MLYLRTLTVPRSQRYLSSRAKCRFTLQKGGHCGDRGGWDTQSKAHHQHAPHQMHLLPVYAGPKQQSQARGLCCDVVGRLSRNPTFFPLQPTPTKQINGSTETEQNTSKGADPNRELSWDGLPIARNLWNGSHPFWGSLFYTCSLHAHHLGEVLWWGILFRWGNWGTKWKVSKVWSDGTLSPSSLATVALPILGMHTAPPRSVDGT